MKTVTVDQTLAAGRYLLAFMANHATPSYRYWRGAVMAVLTGSNLGGIGVKDTSYGALPDPGTKWDSYVGSANIPHSYVVLAASAPA